MRSVLPFPFFLLPFCLFAQGTTARFIEVQVSDTVRLHFEGMDLEVRMDDPTQLAMTKASEAGDADADYAKLIKQAEAEAKTNEAAFLAMLQANGYTFRKRSTEHVQDHTGQTDQTFEVNTYLLELKATDMEGFYAGTEGHPEWSGSSRQLRYGHPSAVYTRLMRKLHDNAKRKAEALVTVAGGKLGRLLSAQEVQRSEGSVLEQLFKLDKRGDQEEMLLQLGSTEQATMAFRFELLEP